MNESSHSHVGNKNIHPKHITVIGGGPAGTLMSIFLARRGHAVTIWERMPDPRHNENIGGRSINLALADRGIHALEQADVLDSIKQLLVPVRGRMVHAVDGQQIFAPYGQNNKEVIYSISRTRLNQALLTQAEQLGVTINFRQSCLQVDKESNALLMHDLATGLRHILPLQNVIAADGAGSVLRRFLVEHHDAYSSEQTLAHGYKELSISAELAQRFGLSMQSLHIWPRGDFMLMALPNVDGTFTATLFMPNVGPTSFAALTSQQSISEFFQVHFKAACEFIPDYLAQFVAHPTGHLGTILCNRWTLNDKLILLGDAAHAIVPFHGQGMNCAFEDCVVLDGLMSRHFDWNIIGKQFQRVRKPECDAIAEMALENYIEMRDTVRSPTFYLQKQLSLELERRHPDRFIPRYSMVMFHHEIPYAVAFDRGRIQSEILNSLTAQAANIQQIDWSLAQSLVNERLAPL
jgi:kynurenine 3-monooxygenase